MTDTDAADGDGRLVPPYIVTGGRTRSTGVELALETLVTTTAEGHARAHEHMFEQRRILQTCHDAMSIAEVAAALEVPAGVARVLIGDLVEAGMLHPTEAADTNERLIRRLIDGVRAL